VALHWLIPTWVIRLLRDIEGLSLQVNEKSPLLSISVNGGREQRFYARYMPGLSKEAAEKQFEGSATGTERLLLAVPKLAPNTRQLLITKGLSWIESETGVCHLAAPGILVDTVSKDTGLPTESDSARAKLIDRSGLIAEVILTSFFNRKLRLGQVAKRAGVSSGLASRIFARLSGLNILKQEGSGPNRSWRLHDPGALLEAWSTEERRPERMTTLYVWSRSPADLLGKLPKLHELKIQWAASGLTAANIYAPTLNTTPDPTIWVDSSQPVGEIASLLGGEIVDKGANLQVWQSAGNFSLHNIQPWLPKSGQQRFATERELLQIVSEPRAYIETASLPGRAPEVAQNLRERILKGHG
jgi:AraC-like DNA-binding protein